MPTRRAAAATRARSRKDLLLDAGLDLLDELPVDEITVSAVAERAGVARGLVFYYFDSKEGFIRAVADAFAEQVSAALASEVTADPLAAVKADLEGLLDLIEEHPGAMRASSSVQITSVFREQSLAINRQAVERLKQLIGARTSSALLEATLSSWGIHALDLALRRLDDPQIDRAAVSAVLIAEFRAAMSALAALEPGLGLDPRVQLG